MIISNWIGFIFSFIGLALLAICPITAYPVILKASSVVYLMLAFISSVDPENKRFHLWPSIYLGGTIICLFLSMGAN